MQSSLLAEPSDRNIKAADVAEFAEVAKIVEVGVSLTRRVSRTAILGSAPARRTASSKFSVMRFHITFQPSSLLLGAGVTAFPITLRP